MNSPDLQLQKPPTLRDHLQIRRNAVGLALMLAGVLTFIIFHFTKFEHGYGWDLWRIFVSFIASREFLQNTDYLLGFSGFITLSIGTLITPFLISSIILAVDGPAYSKDAPVYDKDLPNLQDKLKTVMDIMDMVFLFFFVFEAMLKVIVRGFIAHEGERLAMREPVAWLRTH